MATSMREKLRQAAASRMAETAERTTALLDDMDSRALAPRTMRKPAQPEASVLPREGAVSQPYPSTGQDNGAPQKGTITGQDKGAGQGDKGAGQGSTTTGQDNGAPQKGTITGQDNGAGQRGTIKEQDNRAGQRGTLPVAPLPLPVFLDAPRIVRTSAQRKVFFYFETHGSHVSNYDKIIAETGLPYNTVRKGINKLVEAGILSKTPWSQGSARGLQFTFHGQKGQEKRAGERGITKEQDKGAGQGSRTREQDKGAGQRGTFNPYKIDRFFSLSISQERVDLTWPNLAATGFGAHQIEQISQALAELGKPADRIVQSLDHAEWELEHGRMLDKDGQPVTDPCSWVFRSLSRTGYYRRPKGYVSPEEQAAKDAEAEAKAVVAARQAAEQAQFEAWRDGLSPDELTDALRGHPGGPKDAWLKKIWRDRRN